MEAQMWCAAALSACDIAVRSGGTRCTSMRHRVRYRRAAARVFAADVNRRAPDAVTRAAVRAARFAHVGPDIAESSHTPATAPVGIPRRAGPPSQAGTADQDNDVPRARHGRMPWSPRPPAAAAQHPIDRRTRHWNTT
ncbi:hypothetical protein [Burkholderia sp. Nafp2/4-1b]|uniref:hypothetical protein n=1 Tax=Burkholderia sp. Nafp2/4-1b TaxID=2116686 RepID=UPI0013CE7CD3|nr:hypothetical protein [Burkholderia sp. Nafp2/4-1b]